MVTNPSHPAVPDKPSSAVALGDGPYPALAGGQAEGFRESRVCTGVLGSGRSGASHFLRRIQLGPTLRDPHHPERGQNVGPHQKISPSASWSACFLDSLVHAESIDGREANDLQERGTENALAPKKTDRRPVDFLFGTEGRGGEGGKSSRALEPRKELRQHIPTRL